MFQCPQCNCEKFVNSVGPSGLIRTCRNPRCGGTISDPRYSWSATDDEFHAKPEEKVVEEVVEVRAEAKLAPEPAPKKPATTKKGS